MRQITEYLSTKVNQSQAKATDANIHKIVRNEFDRVGLDADLNHIDVSEVHKFSELFKEYDFSGDVSEWNMHNAVFTDGMFYDCKNFNCDLGNWEMKMVRNTTGMFKNCSNFTGDGLDKWKIGNSLRSCELMFYKCESFKQDLSKWRPHIKYARSMFYGCSLFDSNLNEWDMSICDNFQHMFGHCSKFNSPLDKWNINKYAALIDYMFTNATEFCQDLSSWDFIDSKIVDKNIIKEAFKGTSMKEEYLPKCN